MDEHEATTPANRPDAVEFPPAVGATLDAAGAAVVLLHLDGTPWMANRRALHLLGATTTEGLAPGTTGNQVLRSFLDHVPRHLADGSTEGTWHGDVEMTTAAGTPIVYQSTITVHHGPGSDELGSAGSGSDGGRGRDGGFIGITGYDVTHVREDQRGLRHRASHDALTGLANRRQILTALERIVAQQRRRSGHVAAVFVDLDQLKYVNDAFGHQVGDQLLVATAERLAHAVRPDDHVARIGGDEFLVVCADVTDDDAAQELAERIGRALTGRLHLRHLDMQFSVSIGVALSSGGATGMDDAAVAAALVSNADTAMYEAKASGRGRCVMFTPDMRTASQQRTALGVALSQAIDERRLTITYQPVVSALGRRIVAAEALVKWDHGGHGAVDPSVFIPIAEESGSIGKLGQLVLESALLQTRVWRERGVVDEHFAVHVNVSPLQLASSSFVSLVVGLLRQHGLSPHQLVLETREAGLLGRSTDIERSMRSLRRLGVRVAIDHFGSGSGALSVLTELGADMVKIDAAYGVSAGAEQDDARLLHAVVVVAHALDMSVIAERVSDPEQVKRLVAAGCDLLQGDLLSAVTMPDEMPTDSSF